MCRTPKAPSPWCRPATRTRRTVRKRSITPPAKILDPGVNAKFKLTFYVLLSKEYWVLDHAQDYKWAIVGDPTGKFLWFFSRQPVLPPGLKDAMLARAKALGYDVGRLEFPDHG